MSLQEQGFRFILRTKDGRIDGYWEQEPIKPGGLDCTDMEDDVFDSNVRALQLHLERRHESA